MPLPYFIDAPLSSSRSERPGEERSDPKSEEETRQVHKPDGILIVEDDFLIAMQAETALTDAGFSVTGVATTAEEALEMAKRRRPLSSSWTFALQVGVTASMPPATCFATGRTDVAAFHVIQISGQADFRLPVIAPLDELFSKMIAERHTVCTGARLVGAALPFAFSLESLNGFIPPSGKSKTPARSVFTMSTVVRISPVSFQSRS
jgi:CheY-like chemotaxis protein